MIYYYEPHTVFKVIGSLVSFACESFSSINKAGDTNTVYSPSLTLVEWPVRLCFQAIFIIPFVTFFLIDIRSG